MKKKGLLISTIVMVVVLIASLTTATYAWFNAASTVSVDQIALKIDSNAAVSIGAHVGANNTQDDYMFNQVTLGHGSEGAATANTPTYTGGETGLGTTLGFSTATTLQLSTGVGTATAITERTGAGTQQSPYVAGTVTSADATFNPAHVVYKANSDDDDSEIDAKTLLYANANADYIVLKMGAQAAQAGVKGIYAKVTVTTTDTATTLKMSAALHFYIKVGATSIEFDLFNDEVNHAGTSKASLGTSGHTTGGATGVVLDHDANNQAVATFYFLIAGADNPSGSALATDGSAIAPFEIYAYVWGPDQDCVSTATGCALTIDIEFFGVTNAASGQTMLTLS